MGLTRVNPFELLVDDHHGQYTGQVFAETIKRELFPTITAEYWAILETGPDHENYFDVSAELDQHETEEGVSLWWHEGALWAVDWSLIGDADDIAKAGEDGVAMLESDKEAWNLYCALRANLYDGPGNGVWGDAELRAMQEHVERIAESVTDSLPRYISGDFGIEEIDVDVEGMMLAALPGLRELSRYW